MNKGWIEVQFEELVDYIQPTEFIVKSTEYRDNYKIPVLTAGKSFIKGYTNEQEGIFKKLPAIIFDDFTTASRFVNFPFKVKSSAMKILVPSCDLINLKYVFYGMQITDVRSNTHKRYWISDFAKRYIPMPPLNEQNRITDTIEELFSELDNGVANLKLAQNQLKVYRQALLKYAFEGKLTEQWRKENNPEPAEKLLERITRTRNLWLKEELKKNNSEAKRIENKLKKRIVEIPDRDIIPDSWNWISFIKASHRVVDCHNKTAPYEDKGIYLIRTTNVKNGKLDLKNKIQFVSQETYEYWSKRYFPQPDDVLFTREAPMGEAAIIPPDTKICLGQRMMLVKVFPEYIMPKFLLYNILNPSFQKRILDKAIGTGVKHLRVGDVENLVFPICSIKEQENICNQIDSKFSVIDNLEETITIGLQKSEALRQSILKKAFEGKLVPQDSNDEPASELLKRIQAEKKKYQEEQKQQKKRKPKNTKKMSKELSIEEVLKTSDKPMLAKDVWQKSKHKENIEDFYKELKDIQSKIKEVKKGTESLLSLSK